MLICPHCTDEIDDIVKHFIKCDASLDRLAMIGLINVEEQKIINSIRNEKRVAPTTLFSKQN